MVPNWAGFRKHHPVCWGARTEKVDWVSHRCRGCQAHAGIGFSKGPISGEFEGFFVWKVQHLDAPWKNCEFEPPNPGLTIIHEKLWKAQARKRFGEGLEHSCQLSAAAEAVGKALVSKIWRKDPQVGGSTTHSSHFSSQPLCELLWTSGLMAVFEIVFSLWFASDVSQLLGSCFWRVAPDHEAMVHGFCS